MLEFSPAAEEDYYKDPRRRPRFSFFADTKPIPPDAFQLNRELAAHDVRPEDMKKIEEQGVKNIGQIRKEGVNSFCKRLGLHSSMRYALQNMLESARSWCMESCLKRQESRPIPSTFE